MLSHYIESDLCFRRQFFVSYIASALGGISYTWCGLVPVSILMNRWFRTELGTAMALCTFGSSVATIFFSPLTTNIIENKGLKAAFLTEAAFTLFAGLIIVLLIREDPQSCGLRPYDRGKIQSKQIISSAELDSRKWMLILLGIVFISGPATPGFSNLSVLFREKGFSPEKTSWIISYLGMAMIAGKLLFGRISDRLGSRAGNIFASSGIVLGFGAAYLCKEGSAGFAILACTAIGMGLPFSTMARTIWARDFFKDGDRFAKATST